MSEALPCIKCGKSLSNAVDHVENQPNDGVVCKTSGNYGSTVYDDFDGKWLEFNLCDNCLVALGNHGLIKEVEHIVRPQRPEWKSETWDPQK